VIKLFLAPQGCDVVEATNGKEALDTIAAQAFDIVLLDVHMPVMDGKEAIQRMRANEKWKSLPVIALTADAMSGDRERYLGMGMNGYLSKPLAERDLLAEIARVRSGAPAPMPAPVAKAG
jgi:two-component system, sensor histidine kinase